MTRWLCLKAFVANVSKKCRLRGFLRGFFHSQPRFHVSEFSEVNYLDGPKSENVSLRVMSVVAKFHAFIINLNNSVFFWSITAGL